MIVFYIDCEKCDFRFTWCIQNILTSIDCYFHIHILYEKFVRNFTCTVVEFNVK